LIVQKQKTYLKMQISSLNIKIISLKNQHSVKKRKIEKKIFKIF